MIDLSELKDKLDAQALFRLNEPFEYVGELENADNALERIKLVLTQTFNALNIPPFKQFIIFGSEKTILIIHHKEEIIGAVFPKKISIEDAKKIIYEESELTKKKEEVSIIEEVMPSEEVLVGVDEKILERESLIEGKEEVPLEVSKEKEEESKEESKVITVEKEILAPTIINKISEIAHQYLGDFSLDIVSNVIDDSELDKENPTMDQVLEVINSLKNAASLIIGPSKAGELEKDILKLVEKEG